MIWPGESPLARVVCTAHDSTTIIGKVVRDDEGLWLLTNFDEEPVDRKYMSGRRASIHTYESRPIGEQAVWVDCPTCGSIEMEAGTVLDAAERGRSQGRIQTIKVR